MPPTTSWVPFFTAAPWRTAWPMRTSPRSPTYTGVPPSDFRTMFLMSSSERISPTPRMMYCSDCCDTMLPPTFELLSRIRSCTASSGRSYLSRRSGSTTTWYSCRYPPKELTSVTPGTLLSRGVTTQSCSVRRRARSSTESRRGIPAFGSSVYW